MMKYSNERKWIGFYNLADASSMLEPDLKSLSTGFAVEIVIK